jgi:cytosine/adenosine deaminase-related metal-dependent hydrolase
LTRYRAAWVVPISEPPFRDGWIAVDRGRIVAMGRRTPDDNVQEIDLGAVAVLPGLVNAHTHLELSYLRDCIPPAREFVTWVRQVIAARRERPDPGSPEILSGIHRAIAESRAAGTAVVGDISNTLATYEPLKASPLAGVVFYELIRFNAPDSDAFVEEACRQIKALQSTERLRPSLAAHAPYSVAPLVFRAIRRAANRDAFAPCSVHLAESSEEVDFILDGSGPWRALLEDVGAWNPAWVPPAVSPVEFLDNAGFLDAHVIAVHGVKMTGDDLARLKARATVLVTCPRSNGHTGAGVPPIEDFFASGVRVAIGTDSLASSPDLSVFAEMATIHALAPSVPPAALLDSATRQGARALGLDASYGTLEPGKVASILAVSVPSPLDDVEEYLVSGVRVDQVRWVGEH